MYRKSYVFQYTILPAAARSCYLRCLVWVASQICSHCRVRLLFTKSTNGLIFVSYFAICGVEPKILPHSAFKCFGVVIVRSGRLWSLESSIFKAISATFLDWLNNRSKGQRSVKLLRMLRAPTAKLLQKVQSAYCAVNFEQIITIRIFIFSFEFPIKSDILNNKPKIFADDLLFACWKC